MVYDRPSMAVSDALYARPACIPAHAQTRQTSAGIEVTCSMLHSFCSSLYCLAEGARAGPMIRATVSVPPGQLSLSEELTHLPPT